MHIAFYKGKTRLFNKFVAWWTMGPYSHVEAVFSVFGLNDGELLCASSSFMDDGVRFKTIALNPDHWDILEVPAFDGCKVYEWFHDHAGDGYDAVGLFSTSLPIPHNQRKYFCNEAIGMAAGLMESWRFNPNSFARLCERLPGSKWVPFTEFMEQQRKTSGQSRVMLA